MHAEEMIMITQSTVAIFSARGMGSDKTMFQPRSGHSHTPHDQLKGVVISFSLCAHRSLLAKALYSALCRAACSAALCCSGMHTYWNSDHVAPPSVTTTLLSILSALSDMRSPFANISELKMQCNAGDVMFLGYFLSWL